MKYYIFESGSKGNCTLIASNGRYLMIDNGLSNKKTKSKLKEVNVNLEDVEALLLTHSHTDHIAGINAFSDEIIYATKFTYKKTSVDHQLVPFKEYDIAGMKVICVPTSHDSQGSCGFIIKDDKDTLVYITDTGYIYERVVDMIMDATYYIFESNHNVRMLMNTNRPQHLKKRIMGDYGHLSNVDSSNYLCDVVGENTKEIVLAHLSEEANSPDQAMIDLIEVFEDRGVDNTKYLIRCASQTETLIGGNVEEEVC